MVLGGGGPLIPHCPPGPPPHPIPTFCLQRPGQHLWCPSSLQDVGTLTESLLPLCGLLPLGTPSPPAVCLQAGTQNPSIRRLYSLPQQGLCRQRAPLCSFSVTHLGSKGFIPWGVSRKATVPPLWGGAWEGFQGSRALCLLPALLGACVHLFSPCLHFSHF